MTNFRIGSYNIESMELFSILQEAKISSDKELAALDKNKDKKISEDELVEVASQLEDDGSKTKSSNAATSMEESMEKQILALYEQLDKLMEDRRKIYSSLGTSSDMDDYNSTLENAKSLNSQISSLRTQIYQCYYNMEVQAANQAANAANQAANQAVNAANSMGTTNAMTGANGGTFTYSGDNAQFVNKFNSSSFQKGVLNGQGAMVASIAQKYGLDPNLLASIMALETGWGTSSAIKNYNNPGGMMDPSSNWMKLKHYSSLQEGIEAVARNLKNNYINKGLTTISSIGAKYCPVGAANDPNGTNGGWVPSVTKIYNMLTGANINANTKIA